jgi:ssRNA-specific RNase YbeY (16S rRNA maturation enzyme)
MSQFIEAANALALPVAQLSSEEKREVDKLLDGMRSYMQLNMQYRGIDYKTDVTNMNVVAAVREIIRRHGFDVQVLAMQENARLQGAAPRVIGHIILCAPSSATYQAHGYNCTNADILQ